MALPLAPTIVGRNTGHGSIAVRIRTPRIDGSTAPSSFVLFRSTSTAFTGTSAVHTVTVDATGGTFTVTVNGQTTTGIAANATEAVVLAALVALSNVIDGDIVVVRTGSVNAYVYTLTFQDTGLLGFTVMTITANGASLTGGAGTALVATTTTGVVALTVGITPDASGYTQSYDESGANATDYFIVVRAKNAEGYSAASNEVHVLRSDTSGRKGQYVNVVKSVAVPTS